MKYFGFIFVLFCFTSQIFPQGNGKAKYFYTYKEVFDILNKSNVHYNVEELKDTSAFHKQTYMKLSNNYYADKNSTPVKIGEYNITKECKEIFDSAESYFAKNNYEEAINLYRKCLLIDKNFYKAYIYIGDCYFTKSNFDSSIFYYKKAIEKNNISYQAHWFLADALSKTGKLSEAYKEILTAHLLNRNYDKIFAAVKSIKSNLGGKWNEWELTPLYKTTQNGDTVKIGISINWMGYAFADALWKYEPGFAKNIIGKDFDENTVSYEKEAGCLAANIPSEGMGLVRKIIDDGYFRQAVIYEILLKKAPYYIFTLPEEEISKLIEYINKYH